MHCRNCNNILGGDEDFCPRCGFEQKATDPSENPKENEKNKIKKPHRQESSIFQNEPVYIYTDPPKEKDSKKTGAAVFVSLLVVTLLIIGVFTLGEYFQLTPAFSELFGSEEPDNGSTSSGILYSQEYDISIGTVLPDINLKSALCTVVSEKGLTLRKGPDNSYAAIKSIPFGTRLQLTGKSLSNDMWGYVYIPAFDIYGWLLCSYVAEEKELTEAENEVTAKADTEAPTTENNDN